MAHNYVREWREFEHLCELPNLEDLVTMAHLTLFGGWIFSALQWLKWSLLDWPCIGQLTNMCWFLNTASHWSSMRLVTSCDYLALTSLDASMVRTNNKVSPLFNNFYWAQLSGLKNSVRSEKNTILVRSWDVVGLPISSKNFLKVESHFSNLQNSENC